MSYPDAALASDERVVLHRHPHFKRLIPAVLALLLGTAVAAFAAGLANSTLWGPTVKNGIFAGIGVIWLAGVGWLSGWPFLSWLTTHFVVTDRRVMFRHGVLTRSGLDIPLARISSVEFSLGIVDRILRAGTLIIESASQDALAFHDIPQAQRVHALLYHEVFDTPCSEESWS